MMASGCERYKKALFLGMTGLILLCAIPVRGYWASDIILPDPGGSIINNVKKELDIADGFLEGEIAGVDTTGKKIHVLVKDRILTFDYFSYTRVFLNGSASIAFALRPVTGEDYCLARLYFNRSGRLALVEGLYYIISIEIAGWSREGGYLLSKNKEKIICNPQCFWKFDGTSAREALVLFDFQGNARKVWLN